MKMSIVIPCYNEEENIPIILDKFDSILENEDIEIILVNNGSTDNSDEVLKSCLIGGSIYDLKALNQQSSSSEMNRIFRLIAEIAKE